MTARVDQAMCESKLTNLSERHLKVIGVVMPALLVGSALVGLAR